MTRFAGPGRWALAFAGAALIALLAGGCADDPPDVEACNEEPEAGDCDDSITKYYYDPYTGECEEFTWSGCGGAVPFDSMAACEEACE